MNLWDLRTLIWYLVPVPWVGKVTRPSFLVGSRAGIWSWSIPSGASSKCWCCCWRFPEDVIFSMHWISMFWAYSSSSNYTALPTSSPSSGTTFALLYSLIWMSNVSSWNDNQTFFSSTGHSPHPLCTFYLIFFFFVGGRGRWLFLHKDVLGLFERNLDLILLQIAWIPWPHAFTWKFPISGLCLMFCLPNKRKFGQSIWYLLQYIHMQ